MASSQTCEKCLFEVLQKIVFPFHPVGLHIVAANASERPVRPVPVDPAPEQSHDGRLSLLNRFGRMSKDSVDAREPAPETMSCGHGISDEWLSVRFEELIKRDLVEWHETAKRRVSPLSPKKTCPAIRVSAKGLEILSGDNYQKERSSGKPANANRLSRAVIKKFMGMAKIEDEKAPIYALTYTKYSSRGPKKWLYWKPFMVC